MKFPQNILVIVSGKRRTHYALNRALKLAELYDIKLTLFSCVYDPGTDMSPLLSSSQKNQLREKKLAQRLEYLDDLKMLVAQKGIPVTSLVRWNRKIRNAVYDVCSELNPDLVIKRISSTASSINPFTMPMDWQLLRKCPAPLLLVKDQAWKMTAPVLAAVDASTDNVKEQKFNQRIIGYAKLVSKITDSASHVITTHINPTIDNAIDLPDFDLDDLRNQVTELNHNNLTKLVADHNIDPRNLHVIEGLAEDRIPARASELGAQLVVMGTLGRRGIKGAFMGNTAERVLTHLQCEVLALKPKK